MALTGLGWFMVDLDRLELPKMYWAMGETSVWAVSLFVTASPRLRQQARASSHTRNAFCAVS